MRWERRTIHRGTTAACRRPLSSHSTRQETSSTRGAGPTWDQESGEWVEPDDWPANEHGIFVDYQDNVWIAGNGMSDHVVLKFTPEGERLLRIGEWQTTMGSNDPQTLGRPADITVDPETHEVYVADGYLNRRVIVFDADTGEYKRHWGAFGTSRTIPSTPPSTCPTRNRCRCGTTPCTR